MLVFCVVYYKSMGCGIFATIVLNRKDTLFSLIGKIYYMIWHNILSDASPLPK